ncbi:MAG: mechanosensitive ion channel [Pyrinomonadaceae bacterium]|nr:mechanosensitive ion channel [Pyrinomonadaceae bacterium]
MKRPQPRTQIALFLIVAALLILALYAIHASEPALISYVVNRMGPHPNAQKQAEASAAVEAILKIIKLLLWSSLIILFVRVLSSAIFGLAFRLRRGAEAPSLIRNIFSLIAFTVLFFIAFSQIYPNVNLGALFTTSAIFGVILGLALQDTLGNLFAGLSLHADNPFEVGDVISFGPQQQYAGVVESITWRAVKIRTFQNKIVLVSNSNIAKEAIEVAPHDNLNARLVFFNTRYRDSPAKTIHIVREAVREAENVSQKIKPIVRIRALADSGVDYEVKYWLEDYAKYNDTDALVRQRIWYAFRRAGISFAFPTRTLKIERQTKTDEAQISSDLIERLSAVDIFAPLSTEETARLAGASMNHVFAPGETVIRAGDKGSSMFVVNSGRVQVQVTENGKPRNVAVLKEGDFFGEMALFTREPRTANVIAMEETEVLEIGYDAMKHLFDTNPDLVESLSQIIAERQLGLKQKATDEAEQEKESQGIMATIRKIFGFD